MLKIRRSRDRLISNMGIPIPGKDGLYIETVPRYPVPYLYNLLQHVVLNTACGRTVAAPHLGNLSQQADGFHGDVQVPRGHAARGAGGVGGELLQLFSQNQHCCGIEASVWGTVFD